MFVFILILIFVRPFISSLAFPYVNLIYSALLGAALLTWVALKGIKKERVRTVKYALLLFALSLLISLTFSHDKISSTKELYKYITAILLIFFGVSLTKEERLKIILAIVLAGLTVSFLAIYQYFFGFRHILNYLSKENISNAFALDYIARGRAFLPFVTPNILAGYLIMIIPLTLMNKNNSWVILPSCIALLLTKSLGAFFSIFFTFGAYFYLQGKSGKKGLFLLLGISTITAAVFIARSSAQKEHLQPIFSTVMRLSYWKETWDTIKAHPFTGVGLGNFNLAYSRYAHNSYLQFWAEAGILGIISLFWLVCAVFTYGFKKSGIGSEKKYFTLGLLLASSTFIIHNLIDFSFFLPEVSLIWWITLGCILTQDTEQ
jgi:putative inorganic carbon (HCO3(-)) transporter